MKKPLSFLIETLRNTFHAPITEARNPELPAHTPLSRGHVRIQIAQCNFCTLCAKKCPTHAIEVDRANRVWTIDRLHCVICTSCVESCAKKALELHPEQPHWVLGTQKNNGKEIFIGSPPPAPTKKAPEENIT